MNEQQSFDGLEAIRSPRTLHRTTDETTSREAAHTQTRRGAHLHAVLSAYRDGAELTDVQASSRSGLDRIETTRRASELRGAGLIEKVLNDDGTTATGVLPTGKRGMLCRITEKGLDALREEVPPCPPDTPQQ